MFAGRSFVRVLIVSSAATGFVVPSGQAIAQVEAEKKQPKPLEARARLVAGFAAESVMQSVENLPNFDDTVSVIGTMSASVPRGTYHHDRLYIPRLNRVRKILAQTNGTDRDHIVAVLRDQLRKSADGFEAVYQAREQAHAKVTAQGQGLNLSEPDECWRRRIYAPAAMYILTELRCFEALPVMAQVYEQPGRIPVSRLTLLYAMHQLAKEHPRQGLSADAQKALDEYLEQTKDLPAAAEKSLPTWNAPLTETDFRATILRQDIGLDQQPQLVLHLYPAALDNYEAWSDDGWHPTKEMSQHFPPLRRFIHLAYPAKTGP